ncbi:hypothetical protein DDE18_21045 [Nocardioides gansuensis]|uniref:Uncharacterized protein n=1 Tax=Nocardioides gansuensis TaxID=2138300 RepID=A0A2T8F576_9ACTN|nr:hypothetical protein [Nocardioides gansuensis]PVG80871.1 hypothetical protein DDE18_21045 [Nocardioides gansuensis]
MSLAQYTFASSVRRGFTPDASGRANVTVSVAGQADFSREVELMTAADAIGLPPGQVIRTWPRPGVQNAEPNYLALVEFDAPNLPWLLGRPDPAGMVHPWLMLVVVEDDGVALSSPGAGHTSLLLPADQRPDPGEAWLWAHAQLLDRETVPDDPSRSLSRLVSPRRLEEDTAYVGCVVPTFESGRLAGLGSDVPPEIRIRAAPGWDQPGDVELPVYYSFRFRTGPAGDFESLVRRLHGVAFPAGLGLRKLRLDHPLSNLPSSGAGDLDLPVALRPIGPDSEPVAGLVATDYLTALRARLVDADYDVSLLGTRLPKVGPPVYGQLPVGAPARAANLGSGLVPPWLEAVNTDPRNRVAAGLGAEVVRRNQERYMEEAWRQVGDVNTANRLRRRAEYSLGATQRLFRRWLSAIDAGDLVTVTSPVHAKVSSAAGETLVGRLRDSPLPPAVLSVELRRFARTRGQLSHATDWQASAGVAAVAARAEQAQPLFDRVALDGIETLDPPSTIWGNAATVEILGRLVTEGVAGLEPEAAARRLDAISTIDQATLPEPEAVARRVTGADLDKTMTAMGLIPTAAVVDAVTEPDPDRGAGRGEGRGEGRGSGRGRAVGRFEPGEEHVVVGRGAGGGLRGGLRGGGLDNLLVRAGRDRLDLTTILRPTEVLDTIKRQPGLVTRAGDRVVLDTGLLEEAARTGLEATTVSNQVLDRIVDGTFQAPVAPPLEFRLPTDRADGIRAELGAALAGLLELGIRPDDGVPAPGRPLDGGLESLRGPLLAALDPSVTILRAVNSRIAALADADAGGLDDIMAAPDLSEPTYLRLSEISQDWLLPGLDDLPADTTTLVQANLDFIAAFLVGMNHEIARELLWREYPTDQRGTYARQFWTHVGAGGHDLAQLLHAAPAASLRGLTRPAGGPEPQDPLVLVVKAELVQRYPGLIIVAATTEKNSEGVRVPKQTMVPDFVGTLEPDVMLVGFTGLTAEMVRDAEAANDPEKRWWFYFSEHFTEPRFGLDAGDEEDPPPPTSWNEVSWNHVQDATFLQKASFSLSLPKGLHPSPLHAWGTDAARQAWITLQFPFRRGIAAVDLLPEE